MSPNVPFAAVFLVKGGACALVSPVRRIAATGDERKKRLPLASL